FMNQLDMMGKAMVTLAKIYQHQEGKKAIPIRYFMDWDATCACLDPYGKVSYSHSQMSGRGCRSYKPSQDKAVKKHKNHGPSRPKRPSISGRFSKEVMGLQE
ncbi:hypothetical protein EC957_011705, partial [Mortierella hygrophila]